MPKSSLLPYHSSEHCTVHCIDDDLLIGQGKQKAESIFGNLELKKMDKKPYKDPEPLPDH